MCLRCFGTNLSREALGISACDSLLLHCLDRGVYNFCDFSLILMIYNFSAISDNSCDFPRTLLSFSVIFLQFLCNFSAIFFLFL